MSLMEHAACAASLFAVDPIGLGGVCLRSPAQPARERWLRLLRESLPEETPWRRIPSNIPADRLLGDLDMAATLKAARPLAERGALAAADGGLVVIAMAERMSAHTASLLNGVIDSGQVLVPRSGVMIEHPARIGIVALDESEAEEDSMPPALMDRLAIVLDLHDIDPRSAVRGFASRIHRGGAPLSTVRARHAGDDGNVVRHVRRTRRDLSAHRMARAPRSKGLCGAR